MTADSPSTRPPPRFCRVWCRIESTALRAVIVDSSRQRSSRSSSCGNWPAAGPLAEAVEGAQRDVLLVELAAGVPRQPGPGQPRPADGSSGPRAARCRRRRPPSGRPASARWSHSRTLGTPRVLHPEHPDPGAGSADDTSWNTSAGFRPPPEGLASLHCKEILIHSKDPPAPPPRIVVSEHDPGRPEQPAAPGDEGICRLPSTLNLSYPE